MRFLIDESAEFSLVAFLQGRGFDTSSIVHDYTRSLKDREILDIALREQRVIITNDKDFGELIYRLSLPHYGVILFRLGDEAVEIKKELLSRILSDFGDRLEKSFVVVTETKIRFRK